MMRGWVIAGCLAAALTGCGTRAADTLTVAGSSTMAPLVAELAQSYEAAQPGARVDVQSGGSGRGLTDLRGGLAGIGMVSRALSDEETREGFVAQVLARDGIALIVHRDNPIATLGDEQVRALYTGRVRDWAALGAGDGPVMVVQKAAGRATLAVFMAHFGLDPAAIRADLIAGENQQVIQAVAGNRAAVGYVSVGSALTEQARGVAIRLPALNGIPPGVEQVASGAWPLSRPLLLVTLGPPHGTAARFIRYAVSSQAQALVRGYDFVPAGG